jgi:DNA-binding transcriptional LysR family regulator
MDQLQAMSIFVKIVDAGSLSSTARSLQVSLPVVSRALAALEARLGVRLFNRTTRRLALTEAGNQYYAQCKHLLEELAEAELSISRQKDEPIGTLNLNASVLFGRLHVAPLVTTFLSRHPGVAVNLMLMDRNVNLIEEGVDVAIRIGHLADSSLVARKLGHIRHVVCATPDYLARQGEPKRPQDLEHHYCLQFTALTPGPDWHFQDRHEEIKVRVNSRFSSNHGDAVIDAAVQGLGLAMVLSYQIQPYVASGVLSVVLEQFEPPPVPIHAVYPHARLLSAKVRVFLDFIAENLRQVDFLKLSPSVSASRQDFALPRGDH